MPTLHRSLLGKTFSRLPKSISPEIESLCTMVSPEHAPRLVDVRRAQGCIASECFHNVTTKVQRDGGNILYGWSISEWPRVFVQAEHHAIWINGDTEADITPHIPATKRILFLPDPERSYDFKTGRRILNVNLSLNEFSSAQELIDVSERWQRYMEEHSNQQAISIGENALRNCKAESEKAIANVLVDLARSTKPADKCFCHSGMSFARCCARKIDLS